MAKHKLEDIVPSPKIRKSAISEIKIRKEEKEIYEAPIKSRTEERTAVPYSSRSSGSRYGLWWLAALSVIFLGFAVSFLFSSAKVNVVPRTSAIEMKENFSASAEPVAGGLFFDLVVISGEEKKTLEAGAEEDVAIKASGQAVIFNSFSSAPQRLDIDTRLEGSNGKLYKTKTKTTVPGKSADGTPGQVEIEIYAAEAGEEYNSGPIDFQILGFKGTPKYDAFQVRTKEGTVIKGGFKGKAPIIENGEKEAAAVELLSTLKENLSKKAAGQIPEGFILYKDAVFLDAPEANLHTEYADKNKMTLIQKGTLYGILFNEQKLTKKIAEAVIDKYEGGELYISNMKDLHFELLDSGGGSLADLKNISFVLSGTPKFVWKINENTLLNNLIGQPKDRFQEIVAKDINIKSAILKITPPWRRSIPERAEEIKVIIDYPQN